MVKFGVRKPSLKRSISARTTGRLKRSVKKSINPLYGKKGMGLINNPKKAVYNSVYHRTNVGINPLSNTSHKQRKTTKQTEIKQERTTKSPLQTLIDQGPNFDNLPKYQSLLLINSKDIETQNFTNEISEVTNFLMNILEKSQQFSGLKRKEIISDHFNQKIYQFSKTAFFDNAELHMIEENGTFFLVSEINSQTLKIAQIDHSFNNNLSEMLLNDALQKNLQVDIRNFGGKYKKTVINKDGSISVRSFYEPISFSIEFFDATNYLLEKEKRIQNFNHQIADQKRKQRNANIGCFLFIIIAIIIIAMII